MRRSIAIGAAFGAAIVLPAATACAPDPPSDAVGLVVTGCRPGEEIGSGMLIGDDLALVSAHVVAGARTITVHHATGSYAAEVVAVDPDMDLAAVAVDLPPHRRTPIRVTSDRAGAGDSGVAYVFRDREIVGVPVTIRRRVRINTEDVYVEGETRRPGFELTADIRAGDSGGAVVVDGELVGVVWARSRRADDRAWAIDPDRGGARIRAQLASGELGDDVDLARCS